MDGYITPEIISSIITIVVLPLLGIIIRYLVRIIRVKSDEIKQKIDNSKINKYIEIAEDSVCTSVVAVNQIFVESLKKEGKFDQSAREEAFSMAKQRAVEIMGDTVRKVIEELFKDMDIWIDSKIEYYVNKNKK